VRFKSLSLTEKWAAAACVAVILVAATSCGVTLALKSVIPEAQIDPVAEQDRVSDDNAAFHVPSSHSVYSPGAVSAEPRFTDAASTSLQDSDEVFGILVDSKPYAFPRHAMQAPSRHIINLNIDATPVSVTYCDIADRARVLSRPRGSDPFELRIGGLDDNDQMVLMLEGARYGQSSLELPLDDLPFERTTFAKWIAMHPESMIYEG
jgi:hypothetical protein